MFLIGIDEDRSAAVVARVTAHLPVGASLGQVRVVNAYETIMTRDGALYGLDHAGEAIEKAWRMLQVGPQVWELTAWRLGEEVMRRVVRENPQESPE